MYGKDRDDEDGAGETTFHSTDGEFKSHSCTDRRAGYYLCGPGNGKHAARMKPLLIPVDDMLHQI